MRSGEVGRTSCEPKPELLSARVRSPSSAWPAHMLWPPRGKAAAAAEGGRAEGGRAEEGRPRHGPPDAAGVLLARPGAVPGRRRGAGGETGVFSREVPTRISTWYGLGLGLGLGLG